MLHGWPTSPIPYRASRGHNMFTSHTDRANMTIMTIIRVLYRPLGCVYNNLTIHITQIIVGKVLISLKKRKC